MSTFYVQLNFLGCFNFCFPLILFSSEPFDLKKVISGKKVSMFWHLAGTGDIKSNDGKAKAAETGHSRQTKQVMFILVYLKKPMLFYTFKRLNTKWTFLSVKWTYDLSKPSPFNPNSTKFK